MTKEDRAECRNHSYQIQFTTELYRFSKRSYETNGLSFVWLFSTDVGWRNRFLVFTKLTWCLLFKTSLQILIMQRDVFNSSVSGSPSVLKATTWTCLSPLCSFPWEWEDRKEKNLLFRLLLFLFFFYYTSEKCFSPFGKWIIPVFIYGGIELILFRSKLTRIEQKWKGNKRIPADY